MNRIMEIARRANDEERGLSLIELMVAVSVMFIALLVLARTATVAFTDVALARQRQTGAQLANRLLEEVRGLPYETVQNGHDIADLNGDSDPRTVNCGGTAWYYLACPAVDPDAEELVDNPGVMDDGPVVPLAPHQGEVGPPDFPSTYEWAVYVTEAKASDVPAAGALRVTARVSWVAKFRQGLRNFVEARTLIYSPEGCVDSSTHPFSAPCQPYFYGNGSFGAGSIRTTGTIEGITFDSMDIDLPVQSADAQLEQIGHVEGSLNLPQAAVLVNGVETTTDPSSVSSAADDDPSSSTAEYSSDSIGPQAPGGLSVSGSGNQLAVSIGGGMTGSTVSTTAASTTNTCNAQLDGLPCGYGSSLQGGAITESLTLGGGEGTAALVEVAAAGSEGSAYVRRVVPAGSLGLVQETVEWVLPTIELGGLPDGLDSEPAGWEGYWVALTGFTATATSEAGEGTTAPSVTISGGTIRYWDGTGYRNQSLASVPPEGLDINVGSLTHSAGTGVGNQIRVQILGTVTVQPTTTSEEMDGTDRLKAKATVSGPLVVDMTYRVTRNDTPVADLRVDFDAGSARAVTLYQPSPGA